MNRERYVKMRASGKQQRRMLLEGVWRSKTIIVIDIPSLKR
jgi:hypothetical protein